MTQPVFLSAKWKHLAFFNYKVDPAILQPYIPYGTELDDYEGNTYVSIVAFRFENTKLLGWLPAFFHRDFEEVNLRFYVRRIDESGVKRGVVFISEVVPKRMLAGIARIFYKENYSAAPMSSEISPGNSYSYRWGEHELRVSDFTMRLPGHASSFERWITEHYFGYTRVNRTKTFEYEVKHPQWELHEPRNVYLSPSVSKFYGPAFQATLSQAPSSVLVAAGSEVTIHWLTTLKRPIALNTDTSRDQRAKGDR